MHRYFFFVLFLFAVSIGFPSSVEAQVFYETCFSPEDLKFDRQGDFDVVKLRECIRSNRIGRPDLPVKIIHLILPLGSEVAGVSVTEENHIMLPGEYLIGPCQPGEKTDGSNRRVRIKPDEEIYKSDSLYPCSLVEIIEEGYLGGNHLVTLEIHPLRYRPLSQRLFLCSRLSIRVELRAAEKTPASFVVPKRTAKTQRLYDEVLQRMVDNKMDLSAFACRGFSAASFSPNAGGSSYYSYLVVTSSELESAFTPLVEWKRSKGIETGMVCLDSILTDYPGRDDAEKLRGFLIQAYQRGTVWVLLGGDEDVVPIRYAYPSNVSTPPPVQDQQICDLYFSDVDGEWDLDDDGIWGEPHNDDPDIYPDLFLGRVACSDPAEAAAFVEKLISYEKNPGGGETDYLTRALWMCSDQMKDWDGGAGQHSLLAPYLPSHFFQDMATLVESPTGDAENPVGPDGETCIQVMNQGWGIVGVLAHGKASGFVAKSNLTNSNPRSWVLTTPGEGDGHGHMPALSNASSYGILYSISCSQSAIDVDKYPFLGGEPSVAEFYPMASQKGGVAFLGYTRWGWVSISYKLFQKFLENLFDSDLGHHLGIAEALSRCAYPAYRDINYGHNLFGDPEMPVWTEDPQSLAVIHPEEVIVGKQTVSISVTSQGAGVGGAQVSFVLHDIIELVGETDQEGNFSCELDLDDVGQMSLVVTKSNFIPYQDSIMVSLAADIDEDEKESDIKAFELFQNYPNPFNPATKIQFTLPEKQTPIHTSLRIYNILGQVVRTLVDEPQGGGYHQLIWDGTDLEGSEVSSGIYFYTVEAGDYKETKKMTLMR
jgi:hypothetical protein